MNAIDTNVLVRLLENEHPDQTLRARKLFEVSEVFIPITVVLEAFWVLHRTMRIPGPMVIDRLVAVAGLESVVIEDSARFKRAVDLAANGLDFADALHVAAMQPGDQFFTFDVALAKSAKGLTGITVQAL